MSDDFENDEIGYKRPPKKNQFTKGQSGNPKGRPKGSRNFMQVFGDEFNRRVTITENGRRRTVGKQEAYAKKLAADAFNDKNNKMAPFIIALLAQYAEREEAKLRQLVGKELNKEQNEVLVQYLGFVPTTGDDDGV